MISVITSAFNNGGDVKKLLESIRTSTGVDFSFEVIIIDDGSRDAAIKNAAKLYDFARYIRLDKNSGAAAARNRGVLEARYESLFFVDSDVVLFPDTLTKVKKYFSDPDTKAFIGHLDSVPENKGF